MNKNKNKKLKIAKETIQNLEDHILKEIAGGCVGTITCVIQRTCDMNNTCLI